MKRENLSNAMDMLDEDMLTEAAGIREKSGAKKRFSKLTVAAAAIAVIVCGTTAMAAIGGHFVDIKNIFGTVVGTQYVDATDEVNVEFLGFKNGAPDLAISPVDSTKAPYNSGVMKLASYNITDEKGNTVLTSKYDPNTNQSQLLSNVADGSLTITYPIGDGIIFESNQCTIPEEFIPTEETSDIIVTLQGVNINDGLVQQTLLLQHLRGYINPETDEKIFFPYAEDMLESGTYTVNIESFVIESKADQPLEVFGDWTVEFTI